MTPKKVEVTTHCTGKTAFIVTYQDISPFKITTDAKGDPTYFFRMSNLEKWEQYQSDYSTAPIINAETFYTETISLQSRVKDIHKRGGIWHSKGGL